MNRLKVYFHDRESLTDFIVQFAGNMSPLDLLRIDQLLRKGAKPLPGSFDREEQWADPCNTSKHTY